MVYVWLILVNGSPQSAWSYELGAEVELNRLELLAHDNVWKYVITTLKMEVQDK